MFRMGNKLEQIIAKRKLEFILSRRGKSVELSMQRSMSFSLSALTFASLANLSFR